MWFKGDFIKHRNGNTYRVLMVTNQGTENPIKYPVTIVYENVVTGSLWSRPLEDMDRSFTKIKTPASTG